MNLGEIPILLSLPERTDARHVEFPWMIIA